MSESTIQPLAHVTVLFKAAREDDLVALLQAFGAQEKMPGWLWNYAAESTALLEITLCTDINAYESDLALYAFEPWRHFIDHVLGWEPSAMFHVHVWDQPNAVESARAFVATALEHHDGGAVDGLCDHVWTYEQVRRQSLVDGKRFLDKHENAA